MAHYSQKVTAAIIQDACQGWSLQDYLWSWVNIYLNAVIRGKRYYLRWMGEVCLSEMPVTKLTIKRQLTVGSQAFTDLS